MEMLMRYEGRIINGKPSLIDAVTLPENAKIVVTIELPQRNVETITQTSAAEIAKRREMLNSITGIIKTDVDVKAMRAERISKRGLVE